MNKKALQLLIIGIFTVTISQVCNHYMHLSDLLNGALIGTGIGLMALSLILNKRTLKPDKK